MTQRAMTVSDFAAAYGFSPSSVYDMIANQELGCVRRPGCSIRILPRHAVEWETRYECPASKTPMRTPTSSESQDDGLGISAGQSQGAAEAKFSARAQKTRRKLGLCLPTSR